MHDLMSTIAALYQAARTSPVDKFQDSALALMKRHVAFDTALWGRAGMEPEGPRIYSAHLHNLPEDSLASYLRFRERDVIGARAFQAPGRAIATTASRDLAHDAEMLNDHCRRYGLEHGLTICLIDAATGMVSFLSLFRGFGTPGFSGDDSIALEALAPHLVESCHQSRLLHTALPAIAAGTAPRVAACDAAFALIVAREQFVALMRREWPAWRPPALPPELIDCLARGWRGQCVGARITVLFRRENDLYWLAARPTTPADLLTGRRRAVAQLSALGLSHKAVAKKLKMSPATARSHLRAIYAKLGIRTRAQLAVAMAGVEGAGIFADDDGAA